jgi:hypothetical protein
MSAVDTAVDLYKAYLEDLGRIGSRHENLRTFYVSIMSVLFGFLAMAGQQGALANVRGPILSLVGLVGIVICIAWFSHMRSFENVFEAKLETLRQLEETGNLGCKLFTTERERLRARHYVHIAVVDQVVPLVSIVLFGALIFFKLR